MKPAAPSIFGKVLKPLLLAVIAGVAIYAILVLYGDARSIGNSLREFKWPFFLLALLLACCNYLVRFLKWEYYLRCLGVALPRGESLAVFLSGFSVSVSPAKMGEVLKSLLLKDARGVPIARSAPIVVAERLTDMIAILLLALAGAAAYRRGWPFCVGASLVVALIVVAITVRRVGGGLVRLATALPFPERFKGAIRESYEATYLMARWDRLALPTALSLVAWMAECVAFKEIAGALPGCGLDLLTATFIYAFSTAAGAFAMMPGGLGVTEGGLTGLMQVLTGGRIGAAQASAITILTRMATLWFAVAVGLAALAVFMRRFMGRRGAAPPP